MAQCLLADTSMPDTGPIASGGKRGHAMCDDREPLAREMRRADGTVRQSDQGAQCLLANAPAAAHPQRPMTWCLWDPPPSLRKGREASTQFAGPNIHAAC